MLTVRPSMSSICFRCRISCGESCTLHMEQVKQILTHMKGRASTGNISAALILVEG